MSVSQKKISNKGPGSTSSDAVNEFRQNLKVGGNKLARNLSVLRSAVNGLFEKGSCGDRVSSLTPSEEIDWTVASCLVKAETSSCGDGLSSVRTSDETEGTEASSLTLTEA